MEGEGVKLSLRTGAETWEWGTWPVTACGILHQEEEVDGRTCKELMLPALLLVLNKAPALQSQAVPAYETALLFHLINHKLSLYFSFGFGCQAAQL